MRSVGGDVVRDRGFEVAAVTLTEIDSGGCVAVLMGAVDVWASPV